MDTQLLSSPPEGYIEWLKDIKERIRSAQQKAVLAANSEMITLYWQIGRDILGRQEPIFRGHNTYSTRKYSLVTG